MGNSYQKIGKDELGYLIIETELILVTHKCAFYKGDFYEWKDKSVLKSPVTGKIETIKGELYIDEKHWSQYLTQEAYKEYSRKRKKEAQWFYNCFFIHALLVLVFVLLLCDVFL